jgi:hypothetical protein
VLPRRTVGQLASHGREPVSLTQQFVQRVFRAGAQFGDVHAGRHLEQDVPRVDQIAALELPDMLIVIALAFRFRWLRRLHL